MAGRNLRWLLRTCPVVYTSCIIPGTMNLMDFISMISTVIPLHINLQIANFERCERALHQWQAWVKLQLALRLLLLTIVQLYHLPPPLPPPVSNSSCLFTWCQPLYASCCTLLLYFSRYCTARLKIFHFLCIFCVKSIINLLQSSTI